MADNKKISRSDEIFNVLNDIRNEQDEASPSESSVMPENGQESVYDHSDDIDEMIEILNSGRRVKHDEMLDNAGESAVDDDLDSIPVSLFGHLSDEGDSAPDAPDYEGSLHNHFSDQVGEDIPLPEENTEATDEAEDAEEEEEDSTIKKVGRAFQKISAIPKAIIYVLLVVIVSAYLSYFIITVGNDVFALVTESREVTVTIKENMTHEDVGELLESEGVIEYGWVYELYMKYRSDGDSSTKYLPGEYKLKTDYNYSQLIHALTVSSTQREVVRVTIPEGFTVDQIIDLLLEKGVGTREGYIEAINNYPYKWEFVQQLDELGYSEHRKYRLEGYLYPDTYDFYTTESEVYVINKMLAAFNTKFWLDFNHKGQNGSSYRSDMLEKYNMTFDDVIVLASMVQSEGGTAEDFYYISHVFHNRLKKPNDFPYLESDATIQYVLPERETDSSQINVGLDDPYNTYKYKGLPPGAISSPGLDALHAALFPTKPVDANDKEFTAYYFVSNDAGKTYYATTLSGHNKNVAQVKKDNEAMKEGDYVDPEGNEE